MISNKIPNKRTIDKMIFHIRFWPIYLPTLIEKGVKWLNSRETETESAREQERERERERRGRERETRYKVQSNIDRAMQEPLASWWVPTCVSNAYHGVASRMHARPCLCFEGKRRHPLFPPPAPSCLLTRQATKESIDCVTEAQARTNNAAVVASPRERTIEADRVLRVRRRVCDFIAAIACGNAIQRFYL